MISMTGFGSSEYQSSVYTLSVEVKSCNNRYLDINLLMPNYLASLEQEVRNVVRSEVRRGRVDVMVRIRQLTSEVEVVVDSGVVKKLAAAYRKLSEDAGIEEPIRLDHFIANEDALKLVKRIDAESYRAVLLEEVRKALISFRNSREMEGGAARRDIEHQLEQFSEDYRRIRGRSGELEALLEDALKLRFQALVGEGYDRNRILQEVAVLLNKYTVNEEIERVGSHLEQFRALMAEAGAVGKKLDFLCQELNREVNTIASKSTSAEISQTVVGLKDALENIREQLRNIE